jgi:hypothetical protein
MSCLSIRLDIYTRRGRVPLPGIYSPVSGDFRMAYTNKTEASSIEVAPALGGVEVGRIAILSVTGNSGSRLVSERSGCRVAILDVRFRDDVPDATVGIPTVPLVKCSQTTGEFCDDARSCIREKLSRDD